MAIIQDERGHGPGSIGQQHGRSENDVGNSDQAVILNPRAPLDAARNFLTQKYVEHETQALWFYDETFYAWDGRSYRPKDKGTIRSEIYEFLETALKCDAKTKELLPFDPTRRLVDDVIDALRAIVNLPRETEIPSWLTNEHIPDLSYPAEEFLVCGNGLLHLPTGEIQPSTPLFFALAPLPFDFNLDADGSPPLWLEFLRQLWPDNKESIDALQEMFGYLLLPDTAQQKIFLLIGPRRSGKSTIARVLRAMLGRDKVSSPTLSAFGENFGLEPLIGKHAAIISDARLGGRTDQAITVERLLSISGEDEITISRKYKQSWTGKLSTRFVIVSNELPKFTDASGAIASRIILISLKESFVGREDTTLTDRLLDELPGILAWSIEGWRRLKARGHFLQPSSSQEALHEFERLASPITEFLQEKCVFDPRREVRCDGLYEGWRSWCDTQGRKPGTKSTFGRDLRTVLPYLEVAQHKTGPEKRERFYQGLTLA